MSQHDAVRSKTILPLTVWILSVTLLPQTAQSGHYQLPIQHGFYFRAKSRKTADMFGT